MKRNLLLKTMFLLCALIVGSGNVWADDTNTYDFAGGDVLTNNKISKTNSSITVAEGDGSSPQVNSNRLRFYNGNVMTVSAADGYKITNIVFTANTSSGYGFSGNSDFTCSNGSFSATTNTSGNEGTGTWTNTSGTNEVTLTSNKAKQMRISTIVVTYVTSGGGSDPAATLSTTSLDFGNVNIGTTKDLTFTVTPANLTSALSISCNNNKYDVSPTSIAQDATGAQTITVTAAPTAESDDMNGTITISGGGLAANKTVTLTATAFDPANANVFVKVTDASTLRAGDQLLVVCDTKDMAMGQQSGTKCENVSVTIEEGVITNPPSTIKVVTLEGEEDAWYLKTDQGYLWTDAAKNMKVKNSKAEATAVPISISEKGDAEIDFGTTFGTLQYNASSPRFCAYASSQTAVQLYRLSKSVTITSAEYATYSGSKALNFDGVGIKAYTATDNRTYVKLNEIKSGQVPANTPVVLYKEGADGTAISVPVIASAETPAGTNNLCVSNGTDVENMFVLAKKNNKVGFYKWAGSTDLSAGKVYLQGQTTSYSRDFLGFDGETTTAIDNVVVKPIDDNAPMFNLAGQRVNKSYKGVVIVNGKKVVRK